MNRAIEDSVYKTTMVSHKRLEHLLIPDLKGMPDWLLDAIRCLHAWLGVFYDY